jgi:Mn-dependent DtxR family transcriptional regulator
VNPHISDKRRELLQTIKRLTEEKGNPPTFTELGVALKVNAVTAWERVSALIKHGYLTKEPRGARTIELTEAGERVAGGQVAPIPVETPTEHAAVIPEVHKEEKKP